MSFGEAVMSFPSTGKWGEVSKLAGGVIFDNSVGGRGIQKSALGMFRLTVPKIPNYFTVSRGGCGGLVKRSREA